MKKVFLTAAVLALGAAGTATAQTQQYTADAMQRQAGSAMRAGKLYVGEAGTRFEYELAGQQIVEVALPRQGVMRILYPEQKSYIEITAPKGAKLPGERPAAPCEPTPELECKREGEEKVNTITAERWSIKPRGAVTAMTVWWSKERKMPLRQQFPNGAAMIAMLLGEADYEARKVEQWQIFYTAPDGSARTGMALYAPDLGTAVLEQFPDGTMRALSNIQPGAPDAKLFDVPAGFTRLEQPKPGDTPAAAAPPAPGATPVAPQRSGAATPPAGPRQPAAQAAAPAPAPQQQAAPAPRTPPSAAQPPAPPTGPFSGWFQPRTEQSQPSAPPAQGAAAAPRAAPAQAPQSAPAAAPQAQAGVQPAQPAMQQQMGGPHPGWAMQPHPGAGHGMPQPSAGGPLPHGFPQQQPQAFPQQPHGFPPHHQPGWPPASAGGWQPGGAWQQPPSGTAAAPGQPPSGEQAGQQQMGRMPMGQGGMPHPQMGYPHPQMGYPHPQMGYPQMAQPQPGQGPMMGQQPYMGQAPQGFGYGQGFPPMGAHQRGPAGWMGSPQQMPQAGPAAGAAAAQPPAAPRNN